MNDPQAPPTGTRGTVYGIDDSGSIIIRWDNGSMRSAVPEEGDLIRKVDNAE